MGNKNKKNRRMWSGIKPGDENYTPIPANIGLSEEQRKREQLSFWQRAEESEYFHLEGKERWLRACILLNSEEDFRIAYEIGPPDIYTDESLHNLGERKRKATLDCLAAMHPDIIFPEPLQTLPPEPLEPMYGVVMLKDLTFAQLLMHQQFDTYFYPDTATDEINEMVKQFKREQMANLRKLDEESMASDANSNAKSKTTPPIVTSQNNGGTKEAKKDSESDKVPSQIEDIPSGFGGILRQKSATTKSKKKNMVASGYEIVDNEDVRQAIDAPLDDDGWDDL